ncbi:MAG: anthranilate synthase component I family protein [Gammaproteobacteria bacterium]|nr:anthranilate synthase component I family protein [Gammaproteobacteria bacterium]
MFNRHFETLSYEQFKALAASHACVAVYQEIPGDQLTPTNAYLALQSTAKNITLLESTPNESTKGRYSYLCFDPIATIQSSGQTVEIHHQNTHQTIHADPFDVLRQYQTELAVKSTHPLTGFIGGMVGFMSYDAIRLIETIPNQHQDIDKTPDLLFRFYRNHITFDHQTGKVMIATATSIKASQGSLKTVYQNARNRLQNITQKLISYQTETTQDLLNKSFKKTAIQVEPNDADYCERVKEAQKNIQAGDIFQVVLSRQFKIKTKAKPFDIYRALRFSNPSPYLFYIELDNAVIAGASPEKFISIKDNVLESCPLAGTRARGNQSDEQLAKDLKSDPKELAEHMMLVDLARNDLGKVAVPGSVKVTKLKAIETYARVMHLASTVKATLREDMDVFDAMKASFPAGTLSGAPKIKAMEIIDALEIKRRGIYGGVICAIDGQGNLESCLAIRTALIKKDAVFVQAGAGVVHDSVPQSEADETYHKARAILEGILLAEGEIA